MAADHQESLHPQTLIMETAWVSAWFQRLLQLHHAADAETQKKVVYICDRSPYSAVSQPAAAAAAAAALR